MTRPGFNAGMYSSVYVTGPAKIGLVGTNYTLPHNISYLSIGIEHIYSVTYIVKLSMWLISAENFMAKQYIKL